MSKKTRKPVKPSREDIVTHTNIKSLWKSVPKCQNCESEFGWDRIGRRPFLLPCGHSLCETCCTNRRIFWRYKCKLCESPVSVRDTNNSLEFLEYDQHMIGMLATMAWDAVGDIVLPVQKVSDPKKKVCNENCGTEIESSCRHCNVPLCKTCFDRIHLTSNTFQHHVFVQNNEIEFTVEEYTSICQTHSNPAIKYCNTCLVELCTVCESQRLHKTHIIKTISEINESLPLKKLINSTAEAIKLNKSGIKTAHQLIASHKKSALVAIDQITDHFIQLHGQLQRKESDALNAVKVHLQSLLDTTQGHCTAMQNIGAELIAKQKQLQFIASSTETTFLYKNFVDEGMELLFKPCSKEFPNAENVDLSPFQINFNENGVETYFKTDCAEARDVDIGLKSKHHEEPSDEGEKVVKGKTSQDIEEIESFVHIVNIVSPLEIHIQTERNYATLKKLIAVCETDFNAKDVPKVVNVNGMYLIRNKTNFYRGRIAKALSRDLFNVELIDFGKSIQVSIKNIREMSKTIRSCTALTQKCAIFGIKVNSNNSVMCVDFLHKFLFSSPMYMYTYSTDAKGVALVDFQPSRQHISAQKALVTLNYASYDSSHYQNSDMVCIVKEMMKKQAMAIPRMQSRKSSLIHRRIQAIPLAINNPNDFYIVDQQHLNNIQQMNKNLSKNLPGQLLVPCPGDYCIVVDSGNFKVSRAKIINLLDNGLYQVFLIDKGKVKEVKYADIRILPEECYTIYPAAIWCSLIDIIPQDIEAGWSAEAIKAFKHDFTIRDAKYVAWLFSQNSSSDYFDVVIYQVTEFFDICLNGRLVALKHAISCGVYGNEETINKENKIGKEEIKLPRANEQQHMIDMVEFKNPSEFYVVLQDKSVCADNLERQIQEYMKSTIVDETFMKVNQKCLVYVNHKWYRGEVRSLSDLAYNVYMIDTGKTVTVKTDMLAPIPKQFEDIEPKVLKCQMINLAPPAGTKNWPGGAIDYMKDLLDTVTSLAISNVGSKVGDCIPVVLWGREITALDQKWINLNDALQQTGYASIIKYSEVKNLRNDNNEFKAEEPNMVDELSAELAYLEVTGKISDDEIDKRKSRLERLTDPMVKYELSEWLEPEPLKKTVFTATPTYVTKNGLIYMHDNMDKEMLNTIKDDIAHFMRSCNLAAYQQNNVYEVDQPCIAEYHLDKKWYRAIVVKKLGKTQFIVQFVDYGNIEKVSSDRMLKCFVDYDIPIQAHTFKLCDIKPPNERKVWTTDTIDRIHALIVNQICSVRCFPDKQTNADLANCVMPCSIVVEGEGNFDVIEYILEQGWAVQTNDGFKNQKFVSLPHDLDGEITLVVNETKPINTIMETTFDCFEPQETSSRAQTPINVSTITYPELSDHFTMVKLDDGIDSFEVHVARAVAPGTLYAIPNIHKGLNYFDFLEQIQNDVGLDHLENPTLHSKCLIQVDEKWHRGIITSLTHGGLAEVLLVDTLDLETKNVRELKPLPKKLEKIPLWCTKIQINNDTTDVEKLNEIISNCTFFAKIVTKTLLAYIVDLYDSKFMEAPLF